MPNERERLLHDNEVGESYRVERNPVFRAYQEGFRVMFDDYNGVPKGEHQESWYVGRRWDRRTQSFVEAGKAESRLLSFVRELEESPRRTLRVIYGRSGTGKTTFLRYFFGKFIPEEYPDLAKRLAPIIIDCADSALSVETLEQDVDRRVHDCLRREPQFGWLEEDPHYLSMWEKECDFDSLFYMRLWADLSPAATEKEKLQRIEPLRKDFHNFNRVRINYLISMGYTPVVVWDNLDHATLEVQRRAIQLARHKLSWMPGSKVIIAVREYTYPLVQQEIAPAAYLLSDQELFAPDVHLLLDRRVATAAQQLNGVSPSIDIGGRYRIALAHPDAFLRIVLKSLQQREVESALCRLSNDNVRVQLLMANRTFRSGHIPVEMIAEMVDAYTGNATPVFLSWRRFMEGLICGDYMFHRTSGDDASLILNVFECGDVAHEFANSLCMPRLLLMLCRFAFDTSLADVLSFLEGIGYPRSTLRRGTELLMLSNLIQSPQGPLPPDFLDGAALPRPYLVSCTTVGRYYLRTLMKELVYVQHMAPVTSLAQEYRARVSLWKPREIEIAVASAAALIAQVHADEIREREALARVKGGLHVGHEYGFGRLAHGMGAGCAKALSFIQQTRQHRGIWTEVDWNEMRNVLTPPDAIEV